MLYRIITEDINRDKIIKMVDEHFSAFTLYQAQGQWNGQAEASLVIELDLPQDYEKLVYELAGNIRSENKQEAVLVQSLQCNSVLV